MDIVWAAVTGTKVYTWNKPMWSLRHQ